MRGRLRWELRLTWLGGARILDRGQCRARALRDELPFLLREGGEEVVDLRVRHGALKGVEVLGLEATEALADFCTRHRAAWVSDPAGQLRVLADHLHLQRYRQGSAQAEFLLCRECGVLVASERGLEVARAAPKRPTLANRRRR